MGDDSHGQTPRGMALRRTASAAQLVDDLGVGSLVVDTSRQRLGRVMGFYGSRIHLRPPQGGLEWEVSPEYVRVARPEEIVSVPAQMRGRTP